MTIEIKKSVKPIKYKSAIDTLEDRLEQIKVNKNKELIWILEHEEIYTGGTSFSDNEILDKSINFIKTNRGGKITYHGPGHRPTPATAAVPAGYSNSSRGSSTAVAAMYARTI